MFSQKEWHETLKKVHEPSKQWVGDQVKTRYGHYKAEVTKGHRTSDVLFLTKNHEYRESGVKCVKNVGKVNSNTKIDQNYDSMEPREVDCMDTFVAKKFLQLKESAHQRDKEFDLSLTDVRRMISRKTCYYTGMKLGVYESHTHPNQRTIDRIDPTLGYVKGNVVACSHLANQFKNKIEHDFVEFLPRKKMLKILQKMFA